MPAVVFDFDGLMIDSEFEFAACFIEALASRGAHLHVDDIAHLFGSTDNDADWGVLLRNFFGDDFTLTQLEAELDELLPPRMNDLPLLPGVVDLLDAARAAGWAIGLATGQQRSRLDEHLGRLGILERFDAIVTAADVARGKPAPDVYLAVAETLAVPPFECVALEDSIPGCEAALAAGMVVVLCPSRVTERCAFPSDAHRVGCLTEVRLEFLLS
jgi:putative hydrolase of the HAD superfamily